MSDAPQPAEKPKLRWYQYRLAHLFILMTLVAIGCAWFSCKMLEANRRKKAVEAIVGLKAFVEYDYHFDTDHNWTPDAEPPGPAWFRNLVGLDFLADVADVYFTNPKVSDAGLVHLDRLRKLERLGLNDTQVTDAGVEHLKELTELECLWLVNTQVSDAGLEHLKGLARLRMLVVDREHVSEAGIKKLREALPNCYIDYPYARGSGEGMF